MRNKKNKLLITLLALWTLNSFANSFTSPSVNSSNNSSSKKIDTDNTGLLSDDFGDEMFQEFRALQAHMDKMFDRAFTKINNHGGFKDLLNNKSANNLDLNLKDEKDKFIVTVNLPNSQKNDVNVKVQNNRLIITGNVKEQVETTDKNGKQFKQFISSFSRSILLPSEVKPETLKTTFTDKILNVTVDKKQAS